MAQPSPLRRWAQSTFYVSNQRSAAIHEIWEFWDWFKEGLRRLLIFLNAQTFTICCSDPRLYQVVRNRR
jgi:hypothetical protein